jgi:hypothetical protein
MVWSQHEKNIRPRGVLSALVVLVCGITEGERGVKTPYQSGGVGASMRGNPYEIILLLVVLFVDLNVEFAYRKNNVCSAGTIQFGRCKVTRTRNVFGVIVWEISLQEETEGEATRRRVDAVISLSNCGAVFTEDSSYQPRLLT